MIAFFCVYFNDGVFWWQGWMNVQLSAWYLETFEGKCNYIQLAKQENSQGGDTIRDHLFTSSLEERTSVYRRKWITVQMCWNFVFNERNQMFNGLMSWWWHRLSIEIFSNGENNKIWDQLNKPAFKCKNI